MENSEKLGLQQLGQRMRQEWDRRVAHDYRYWMSDGISSDEEMFQAGERDFEILIQGLSKEALATQRALEIGCGVGRLVHSASAIFNSVIGLDVSEQAIAEARRLLKAKSNVELMLGDGIGLGEIESSSIDFAYTFAAMSSMPVSVIAMYLLELSRVLKPGAQMRLQLYLGSPQAAYAEDTIAIRSFSKAQFGAAAELAGFSVDTSRELHLPFEVSDHEQGLVAEIVSLTRKDSVAAASHDEVVEALMPEGEQRAKGSWKGSETEYLMALTRARQHLDNGEAEQARKALEFAVQHYEHAEADVLELLEELRNFSVAEQNKTSETPLVQMPSTRGGLGNFYSGELLEKNMRAMDDFFPSLAKKLSASKLGPEISAKTAADSQVYLCVNSQPLSNASKPKRAAEVWAERALKAHGVEGKSQLLVIGFADAYHLEALAERSGKSILVFEPRLEVILAAMSVRDCTHVLPRLATVLTCFDELKSYLAKTGSLEDIELIIHPQTQATVANIADDVRRAFQSARGVGSLKPTIGVVGPLYGGSLPISHYTTDALNSLEQRTTPYDLQELYEPFTRFPSFLKNKGRIAAVEGQYVETISSLVLEGLSERPVDILICLAQAPLSPRALTEIRKRGIITVMWFVEDYQRFTTWQDISKYYDYMFVIQKGELPRLVEQAGAGRGIYLPVACDPNRHAPLALTAEEQAEYGSEVSFVGAGYNNRRHVFSGLANRDFKIWGTEWPAMLPFTEIVQREGARVSVEDYVKVFNASKVNINLHSSAERDGVEPYGDFVNPRTFELAATGAFQLVDNRSLLPELFEIGKEVITFSDEREMHEKIDYYLAHPEERQAVAKAGRARALKDHTYQARITQMLEHIYADRYDELKHRIQASPWPRTLELAKPHPELHQLFNTVYERGSEPHLSELVDDIQSGSGKLTETEQKLMFLHHIRSQVRQIKSLRKIENDDEAQ